MALDTLPRDILWHLFSFCDDIDRLALSLESQELLQQVEAFSNWELRKIEENHRVDPTWRLGLSAQAGELVVPEVSHDDATSPTKKRKRVWEFRSCWRRGMLYWAQRRHLYTLNSPKGCNVLCCLPDGKRLLSGGPDGIVRMLDLETKRCIQCFETPAEHRASISSIHVDSGHVVACADESGDIYVWQQDGTLLNVYEADCITSITVTNGEILFMDESFPYRFLAIDIASGRETHCAEDATWYNFGETSLLIFDEWLLVSTGKGDWNDFDSDQNVNDQGIHVVRLSDLHESNPSFSFYPANITTMAGSPCGNYVVIGGPGGMSVLTFKDGHLVKLRDIMLQNYDPDEFSTDAEQSVLLFESMLYIRRRNQGTIEVWDFLAGKYIRAITLPRFDNITSSTLYPIALATNGLELFCGFRLGDITHDSAQAIKAYLL